jgi:hypothetical protein
LRDFRYDAIIHLTTAALGAEKFYSLENEARYEVRIYWGLLIWLGYSNGKGS